MYQVKLKSTLEILKGSLLSTKYDNNNSKNWKSFVHFGKATVSLFLLKILYYKNAIMVHIYCLYQ